MNLLHPIRNKWLERRRQSLLPAIVQKWERTRLLEGASNLAEMTYLACALENQRLYNETITDVAGFVMRFKRTSIIMVKRASFYQGTALDPCSGPVISSVLGSHATVNTHFVAVLTEPKIGPNGYYSLDTEAEETANISITLRSHISHLAATNRLKYFLGVALENDKEIHMRYI